MKKIIVSLMIIFAISGIIFTYTQGNESNGYEELIEAFEKTDANFKSYNIKASVRLDKNIKTDDMKSISTYVFKKLGIDKEDITWKNASSKTKNQLYGVVKNKDKNIAIIVDNKNQKESYIIVDITENKVYKHIGSIYNIIMNTLNEYSEDVDIYTCLVGEYGKKIQTDKYNAICDKILYNMSAKEIEKVQDNNFLSVSAYSSKINSTYLQYLGNKVNLNIGIRYSEHEEKTLLYVATPLIRLDY